jgi:hypothetical protein
MGRWDQFASTGPAREAEPGSHAIDLEPHGGTGAHLREVEQGGHHELKTTWRHESSIEHRGGAKEPHRHGSPPQRVNVHMVTLRENGQLLSIIRCS